MKILLFLLLTSSISVGSLMASFTYAQDTKNADGVLNQIFTKKKCDYSPRKPASSISDAKVISEEVTNAIFANTLESVEKYFESGMVIEFNGSTELYSKNQGTMVLKDFLKKHEPQKVTILKKNKTETDDFSISDLETKHGNYQMYVEMTQGSKCTMVKKISIFEK